MSYRVLTIKFKSYNINLVNTLMGRVIDEYVKKRAELAENRTH
jgi:hypothetical protein